MDELKTPLEMFYHWEAEAADQVFLRQSLGNDEWEELTWSQVSCRVRLLASFIKQYADKRALPSGSNVSIWSTNTVDWIIVDLAIALSGHINVPLYPSQDLESARYVLSHADVKLVFLGAITAAEQALEVLPEGSAAIAMRGCSSALAQACDYHLPQLLDDFEPYAESPVAGRQDLFTIMYSSGTTGHPKGVMVHQSCPALAARSFARWISPTESDLGHERPRHYSYLPLSHALERMLVFMPALYYNSVLSVSAGPEHMSDELFSVQPHVFLAVPKIWAKFKQGVDAKISPSNQAQMNAEQKQQLLYQMGLGSARRVMTGSAPIPKDVHAWYLSLDIHLCEGYAMTECAGGGASWQSDEPPIPGCMGTPIGDSQLTIAEDNEIWIKSYALMLGYFKDPEKTEQVFSDGWYRTGDCGYLDDEGRLWLTGRMGERFKTTKGKFINPSRLEDCFGYIEELSQCMAFGHGEDQPRMLCTLSEMGRSKTPEQIDFVLRRALAEVNEKLPRFEQIDQLIVLRDEWTVESGLLTPTLKMKRKRLAAHYADRMAEAAGGDLIVWY